MRAQERLNQMIISQLIEILEDAKYYYGDNEIIIIKKNKAYDITFLGSVDIESPEDKTFFFLCYDPSRDDINEEIYRAPKSPPILRLVK